MKLCEVQKLCELCEAEPATYTAILKFLLKIIANRNR